MLILEIAGGIVVAALVLAALDRALDHWGRY
jgi:hypothetical protein